MLLVGINELRARLLLADLQAQLEANERLLRDFGKQVAYGHWKDGMPLRPQTDATLWHSASISPSEACEDMRTE